MAKTENIDGKFVTVSKRIFTFSNLISFSRFLIAIPVIIIHFKNGFQYNKTIIGLLLYGIISDYLDGLVARKTNTISELGKVIDPISDKLASGTLFIYTVWLKWVPLWFLIFFIARDLLIVIGSAFIKLKYGKVAMSNMTGKISINVISLYWISVFFFRGATNMHNLLLAASVTIMFISLVDYFNRYRKIMRGAQFN